MNRKSTIEFIILTLIITWLSWGTIVIANQFGYFHNGTPLYTVLYMLGGLAPTIIAIVILLKQKIMKPKQLLRTIFLLGSLRLCTY